MAVTIAQSQVVPTGPDAPQTDPQEMASATPPSSSPSVEAQPGDRPSWLPEKFKSAEDLAKAYGELEKQRGQPKAPEALPQLTGKPDAPVSTEELQAYSTEFSKDGKLSDASYSALEAKGFDRGIVDSYVQGQIALAQAHLSAVYDAGGGKEEFMETLKWANQNLSKDEAASADKILQSGDIGAIKTIMAGLQARRGDAPDLVMGRVGPTGGAKPFSSTAEHTKAVQDPRYKISPAYRQEVEDRIAVSNLW